jgi:ABC-type sugar transport system permease subunit
MTPWRRTQSRAAPWFIMPGLILLGLFVVWPLLRATVWSFSNADLLRPETATGVGLSNYSALLVDPRFRRAFANTALFALLVVPVQTVLAFALALWVARADRLGRWLRRAFFAPVVVSLPVLAILWRMLYQPGQGSEMGLVDRLVVAVGGAAQDWLGDPRLALPALAVMSIWQGVGMQMMVFVAGLQGVPQELLEAARIDGASAWQRTVHVIIPALRNTFVFVVTVTTILAFRLFAQPYLMTRGGPQNRTVSVVQSLYEMTFLHHDLGFASAATLLLVAWVGLLTLLQRVLTTEDRA